MNYTELPNPYDFANPINNPSLFAGREAELEEIHYYLEHAKKAPRAINLAIVGERASGKTSILNMIELEAKHSGFCVVRVELDESDAETQLTFFYKLFDSMITTACIEGAYGGINGKTYDLYRNMVDAYEVPEDKIFCPFIFPTQYAKAMNAGRIQASISDTAFKRDIVRIQEDLKRPMAILVDECDVLGKSRVHLEKLRNIFMNIGGFMLVLTGTDAFFPLINDIFSPIIRQFKKINVTPFSNIKETESCISKPLESIGVEPAEIIDFETIHDLSGGRPYEIQLICHFLFRRLQQGRAKTMELTIDVLDDVLKELQSLQDTSERPIINLIRNLDKDQLDIVRILCSGSGKMTFDQIWFGEYLFNADNHWTKEELNEQLFYFEEKGILKIQDERVLFAGDEFDQIYCKYYSRKHGIQFSIWDVPCDVFFNLRLFAYLHERIKHLEPSSVYESDNLTDIYELVQNLQTNENDGVGPVVNPFDSSPGIARFIYEANFNHTECEDYKILSILLLTPWFKFRRWFTLDPDYCEIESYQDDLASVLGKITERARNLGGDLRYELHTLPILPIEVLIQKAKSSKNENIKRDLFFFHIEEMYEEYLTYENIEKAYLHGELALSYNSNPDDSATANNLGYLFMSKGNYELSEKLLTIAVAKSSNSFETSLANYNLGVLQAQCENWNSAEEFLETARSEAEKLKESEQECGCLFILETQNGVVCSVEAREPNLLSAIDQTISVVKSHLTKSDD